MLFLGLKLTWCIVMNKLTEISVFCVTLSAAKLLKLQNVFLDKFCSHE